MSFTEWMGSGWAWAYLLPVIIIYTIALVVEHRSNKHRR